MTDIGWGDGIVNSQNGTPALPTREPTVTEKSL